MTLALPDLVEATVGAQREERARAALARFEEFSSAAGQPWAEAAGLSNRDIAAELFLSPRTVGYHLYKAYPKLNVTAHGQLASLSLPGD